MLFNPNSIMRTMIALLFILSLTLSVVNATPILEKDVSAAPQIIICNGAAEHYCTLGVKVTISKIYDFPKQQWNHVYLWDSHCNVIGEGDMNFNFALASQLPWPVVGQLSADGDPFGDQRITTNPHFCYAGSCLGSNDPCWRRIDTGFFEWYNTCTFRCN